MFLDLPYIPREGHFWVPAEERAAFRRTGYNPAHLYDGDDLKKVDAALLGEGGPKQLGNEVVTSLDPLPINRGDTLAVTLRQWLLIEIQQGRACEERRLAFYGIQFAGALPDHIVCIGITLKGLDQNLAVSLRNLSDYELNSQGEDPRDICQRLYREVEVVIFNSMLNYNSQRTVEQLQQVFGAAKIHVPTYQKQSNHSDCGLFAIYYKHVFLNHSDWCRHIEHVNPSVLRQQHVEMLGEVFRAKQWSRANATLNAEMDERYREAAGTAGERVYRPDDAVDDATNEVICTPWECLATLFCCCRRPVAQNNEVALEEGSLLRRSSSSS